MARITDHKKIERLKQATMKLVVERGFGGASAALIAKEAEVASGYFYMHYKGKYEMVNSILQEVYQEVFGEFEVLIEKELSFSETIETMVRDFVRMANAEPIKVKFLYVLTNDYSFVIDQTIRENTFEIIRKVKEFGQSSNALDTKISEDDLYLILFINTIQYINQRYKNSKQKVKISNADVDHLLYLFNKILR
ncbi:TetR/AcrR family transcriptional regulator [uncultured Draconibacterium sp.]|uniref:TetR/AcrR family transcriptional regulator n=1 Tax=uncultured Draconibacterium sp. TaxID=1573823 RepID=UPI003217F837